MAMTIKFNEHRIKKCFSPDPLKQFSMEKSPTGIEAQADENEANRRQSILSGLGSKNISNS